MNTTPSPNTPTSDDDTSIAAPKKRSPLQIALLIVWLVIVVAWFYFIATWSK